MHSDAQDTICHDDVYLSTLFALSLLSKPIPTLPSLESYDAGDDDARDAYHLSRLMTMPKSDPGSCTQLRLTTTAYKCNKCDLVQATL